MTGTDPREPGAWRCPTCRRPTPADGSWRPFCSRRCKLVDLGRWFDEEYAVPGEAAIDVDGLDARPQEPGEPEGDEQRS